MGKGGCLGDGPDHRDGTRIIRSRIGACAAASPIAETITGGCRCANRERAATGSPSAAGTYRAATPRTHRQVVLGGERRGVGLVGSGSDTVRDSSAASPITPHVPN